MFTEQELIVQCRKGNSAAQEALYKKYASGMRYICERYARTTFEVEDIFQDAFMKIFQGIKNYKGEGSFDGWVRRIFVNTAIDFYKKNKNRNETQILDIEISEEPEEVHEQDSFEHLAQSLNSEEVLCLVNQLPSGYKMVFNLYAIENYSHKEIAVLLQISEGTSKSQLYKARALLRKKIINYVEESNSKVINIQFDKAQEIIVKSLPAF